MACVLKILVNSIFEPSFKVDLILNLHNTFTIYYQIKTLNILHDSKQQNVLFRITSSMNIIIGNRYYLNTTKRLYNEKYIKPN